MVDEILGFCVYMAKYPVRADDSAMIVNSGSLPPRQRPRSRNLRRPELRHLGPTLRPPSQVNPQGHAAQGRAETPHQARCCRARAVQIQPPR
jgi:hypothetical protein